MNIIDSHIHIGKSDFCDTSSVDLIKVLCNSCEETITLMNSNNVEKAYVLPIPHRFINSQVTNTYVLESCKKYPDRFIPFCRIDENLEENLRNGFKGVKLHLVYEDITIKDLKRQLQLIEDFGVPLILHAKYLGKVKQVEEILRIAPNLKLILAHMGRGHIYTSEQVVENAIALKKYPNVFMDTSTVGDLKAIINVCEIIGFNRVLFGSDYPFGKSYYGKANFYSEELSALLNALNNKEKDLIMYDNARRLVERNNGVQIRRAKKTDLEAILDIFDKISEKEKKFLSLQNKLSLIKQIIKSERHCYVAILNEKVVGFLRESGRPGGVSLLEEIVIAPDYRNRGVAKSLLNYYNLAFPLSIAKTNAANNVMIHLCYDNGYIAENPDARRIINWSRYKNK